LLFLSSITINNPSGEAEPFLLSAAFRSLSWTGKERPKIGTLRRTNFADHSRGRLPFHEIGADLIGEPRVQRANIFWPIWKRENPKSFGIGSDNAQGSVNHDQAGDDPVLYAR